MKNSRGFTLIELLVVIGIVAIMGAISTPLFLDMVQSSRYREGARIVASTLRDARSQAVATNQRHQVAFTLEDRTFNLQRDNAGTWETHKRFGPLMPDLRRGDDCSTATGSLEILFNPNGSGTTGFICIIDNDDLPRFRVGVPSTTTGRVVVQRRTGTEWK